MPLAVTHIIPAIALFNHFKDKFFYKNIFNRNVIFIVAFGALLPDIDIPLDWFLQTIGFDIGHGTYTHTLLFSFIFIFPAIILYFIKKTKASQYLFILGSGIIFHLLLDYIAGGGAKEGIMWLYPFSDQAYKIHLLFMIPVQSLPEALDGIILLYFFYQKSPMLF